MKPSSGLFKGTLGLKKKKHYYNPKNQATQNHRHVVLWAQTLANELKSKSNRQREKFNTASVAYDESTGKYYYGRNGGIERNASSKNPLLFGDETHQGILPKKSLNNYQIGNCSEVDAINNALNDNAKINNLHISTIHTTKGDFGKPKQACENCTYSFKGKVKRNYTGWHKEE